MGFQLFEFDRREDFRFDLPGDQRGSGSVAHDPEPAAGRMHPDFLVIVTIRRRPIRQVAIAARLDANRK